MGKPNVGGQAIIEGVMMRNDEIYAVAIRKPDKEIIVEKQRKVSMMKRYKFLSLPLIRGIVAFIESMLIGMKILTYSAEFFEVEDAEESKFDRWLEEKFGDKADDMIIGVSVVLAIIMAMFLFVLIPLGLSHLLKPVLPSPWMVNLADGLIRVVVFLTYITLISRMKDIQRVFQYHGAEHKSINCYEQDMELTVENAMKCTRLHKRCGTSFLLYIVVISIFLLTIINPSTLWMRFVVRIILLPVIAGISYEVLKFVGNSNSSVLDIFAKPGLALQKLTTQEPDEEQMEVALASLKVALGIQEAAEVSELGETTVKKDESIMESPEVQPVEAEVVNQEESLNES